MLYDSFLSLATNNDGRHLNAIAVPGRSNDFIARGAHGEPVILISSVANQTLSVPINLPAIRVEFDVQMEIQTESGISAGIFVVLSPDSTRPDLFEAFCFSVDGVLSCLSATPNSFEISQAVRSLIELFRTSQLAPRNDVVGLWAELFLIDLSRDPDLAIEAWHSSKFDNIDFEFASESFEVKATTSDTRSHFFSLNQLNVGETTPISVVSLVLRKSASGCSCKDLLERIRIKTRFQEHRLKLVRLVHETLGRDIQDVHEIRFDMSSALANARVIESQRLVRLVVPANSGISDVRYSISLNASVYQRFLSPLPTSFRGT